MPKFKFVAMDAQGRETEGVIDADSQARAIALIKEKNYYPTSVTELGSTTVKAERQKTNAGQKDVKLPSFVSDLLAGKVKAKNLMVFTRQLATLLDAGVPLLRGLQILLKQEAHPTLRKALSGIGESVEGGSTFAEALGQHPKVFQDFYVNMVRAGETGGALEEVLTRLAEFMEKAEKVKNKIKSAMVYPIVVLVIALGILTFMIVKIIPKFAEIFTSMLGSQQLPWLTRFVIGLSNNCIKRGPLIVLVIAGLVVAFQMVGKTKKGRLAIDALKLRLPIFGKLFKLTAVAHFARTLSTLLTSGVPILQALNIVSDTVGNDVISQAIDKIHENVKEGESMAAPMGESGVFPVMAISMVEVGEETGALPEMLSKVAETYEDEVDNTVEALTSIIEPVMIVFLAVIVGTIVISMFMPLVTLISQMAK